MEMRRIAKQRTPADPQCGPRESLAAAGNNSSGSRQRRLPHRRFVVVFGVTVLSLLVLAFYAVMFFADSFADEDFPDEGWLSPSENGLAWQEAMRQQSLQNTPPPHSLGLQQLLFFSCNRHDRNQAYWANMAVAAQCELLSRSNRASAAPCRRLYAGQTPLSRLGGVLTEERRWTRVASPLRSMQEVPLGACGSVYDSTAAAQHRATFFTGADPSTTKPATYLRFPVAPLKAEPVPVDAVLWLGDAIYADKRADGQDGQSLLYHHANSLAEVGRFWRIQRNAPEYNAFITSCVAGTGAAPQAEAPNDTPVVQVLGEVSAEVKQNTSSAARVAAQVGALRERGVKEDVLVVPQPPAVVGPQHNVWGTWDDHDMGKNDGGKEYPYRNVTQRFFLDFLKAPATDTRWSREGVYEAYTLPFHAVVDNEKGWGPSFETLLRELYEHAICVVLLDVRSFRDPPNATYTGDVLGDAQWDWLEGELQRFTTPTPEGREPCALTLIGSGIQFMLDEKPAENWAAFPGARDRLLGLLRTYKAERVAFLTGDVHMGELGGDFTPQAVTHVLGYPLLEVTSSGLTHSANMFGLPRILPRSFPTPRRLSLYVEKNFGAVRLSVDLLHLPALRPYLNNATEPAAQPSLFQTPQQRQAAREGVQRGLNVTFTIFSLPQHGRPVQRLNFPLSMLTYADGPAYLDATVDPERGEVLVLNTTNGTTTSAASPATSALTFTTFNLKNGTAVSVPHYPTTSPVPFVTWYSRLAQHYIFTHSSVSESLKWCLIFQICVGVLLLVLFVVWVLVWLLRRVRQRRAHLTTPLLSRNAELQDDTPTFSSPPSALPQRWWSKLLQRFQKGKKR